MASSPATASGRVASGSSLRPKAGRKPNKVRQIMMSEERRSESVAAAAAAPAAAFTSTTANTANTATAGGAAFPASSSRGGGQCPNKNCKFPNVVDGTCQSCGRVADDSNIVSDIQFGETSSGAAVVQGTFLAADQGGLRPATGPMFRRVAGGGVGETRERNLRQAKQMLRSFAHGLGGVPPAVIDKGELLYRLCAGSNFVQGRNTRDVVAACLYSACRSNRNNDIQLIDLADLLKVNVFSLGRTFSTIQNRFPTAREGSRPIILENIVWKFTAKLGFHRKTNDVAATAIRIINRMQRDWMTPGRKPGGIVAAALLISARLHNFRRTAEEVIYIAKVTEHTIHERMKEFTYLPTAQFTIEEFLNQDHLQTEHDPPVFYKQTAEWQEAHGPKRASKRRRIEAADGTGRADSPTSTNIEATPPNDSPGPELVSSPSSLSRHQVDADGFVVPSIPHKPAPSSLNSELALLGVAGEAGTDGHLEALAAEFGDRSAPFSQDAMARKQGINIVPTKRAPLSEPSPTETGAKGNTSQRTTAPPLPLDDKWRADEQRMAEQVGEILHDPLILRSARAVVEAEDPDGPEMARLRELEKENMESGHGTTPTFSPALHPRQQSSDNLSQVIQQSTAVGRQYPVDPRISAPEPVSMDPEVGEDEFADDPEVKNCVLQPAEIAIKERIWVNANKDWLRAQQAKIWKQKMAAKAPPKPRRPRKKKPRIGEGQSSPASTPGEAAVNVLKMRAVSKRINYDRIETIFDRIGPREPESAFDSVSLVSAVSRRSSRGPRSQVGDDESVQGSRQRSGSPVLVESPAATVRTSNTRRGNASISDAPAIDNKTSRPITRKSRAAPGEQDQIHQRVTAQEEEQKGGEEEEIGDSDDYVDDEDGNEEAEEVETDPFESGDEDGRTGVRPGEYDQEEDY